MDQVTIEVVAGRGGHGIVSFRREAYVPRGGPNGGDGGSGGNISLVVDPKLTTLSDFRNGAIFKAPRGGSGGPNNRTGRRGEDLDLTVPPGTMVYDADTGEQLFDLTESGSTARVAEGGRAGRGNTSFATSTRRAPRKATKGMDGERRKLRLELRLMADAGLVGVPNAGKSTILSTVTAARPKVAGYPFTTLDPSLGVVRMGRGFSFVLADLPGLIEGASEGQGLGLRFLRHVSRNPILVFVLGAGLELSPLEQYDTLKVELELYGREEELLEPVEITVLSRSDLIPTDELEGELALLPEGTFAISSVTGYGMDVFLDSIASSVSDYRRREV